MIQYNVAPCFHLMVAPGFAIEQEDHDQGEQIESEETHEAVFALNLEAVYEFELGPSSASAFESKLHAFESVHQGWATKTIGIAVIKTNSRFFIIVSDFIYCYDNSAANDRPSRLSGVFIMCVLRWDNESIAIEKGLDRFTSLNCGARGRVEPPSKQATY